MYPLTDSDGSAERPILLKGGIIVSMDAAVGNFEKGDILIRGSKIDVIAPALPQEDAEIFDAQGMIIAPGFVDCHRHAWQGQLRQLNPNSNSLHDYCCATHFSFAEHYRPLDTYVGTMLTAVSGIDAGITTFIDNAHNARTDEHGLAGLKAWAESGVRAIYAPGPPLTGLWDEAGWPARRLERLRAALAEDGLVSLGVMAQFVPEVWAQARAMRLPIISEVPAPELAPLIRSFDEKGLLGPDNIFNHITAFPPDAMAILRRCGVRVNVCPRSDAQYGIGDGGMGTFQAALDAGLKPALSIDTEVSYGGDMFGEMRAEFFMQRAMTQRDRFNGRADAPRSLTVAQALEAATLSGARCAGLDHLIGSIAPGKEADLIAVRAGDLNLHPLNNAIGALVHGADRGNVDTVIIGGRVRKRHGAIVGLQRDQLAQMAQESRNHLMSAAGYRLDLFCEHHESLLPQNPEFNRFWR